MSVSSIETTIRTLDGLHLRGTLVTPDMPTDHAIVLVHGGGVTRDEGGFFTRLATGLAEAGVAALRYDLRGHGESDGPQQDTTLAGHLNDVSVALQHIRETTGATRASLLGTSFGGGLAAYYAGTRPAELDRLVLLNPQLDYRNRYIEQKPYWDGDRLNDEMAAQLAEQGFIAHSPTVKHGRAFLNEVFWIRPLDVLDRITAPTLLVHGTRDTFVPVEVSRRADRQLRGEHRLVEVEGAQHGFAVHDDPAYADPQSQAWQGSVIKTVCDWVAV
ncbi:alpha/beta hydrolase [Nocardia sp. NRRL S-836]|uniref:alpha/beta hydrolase n=1 Tax=Nocardia sp. NRRL S-836 TaxID=1519492 RepID=UPI0006B04EE2|nr:alpha/beta fold hydrolase [Nocardia sp. NRRL S-836]KOV82529.1 alpha/beta hydrolase [Nocardia sp. NRRL S-836]